MSSPSPAERDFDVFAGYIFNLQIEWELYQSLFLESKERRQALSGGALGDTIFIIRSALERDIVSAFCRLTDPKGSNDRSNLVLRFIVDKFDLKSALSTEWAELEKLRKELKPLRDKRLAHIDLHYIRNLELLPVSSVESVKWAVELLQGVVQKIAHLTGNTLPVALSGHMAAQADFLEACIRMANSRDETTFAAFEPVFDAIQQRSK